MLIKLWPGYWNTHLNIMNHNVEEDNGKETGISNGWYQKLCWFSSNEFWKNIGCLVSARTFGLGGSRLWEKEEDIHISGKKRKMHSINIKVDFYEVCLSYIIYCLLIYFMAILLPPPPPPPVRFVVFLSLREKSSESIFQKYLSRKRTIWYMNVRYVPG